MHYITNFRSRLWARPPQRPLMLPAGASGIAHPGERLLIFTLAEVLGGEDSWNITEIISGYDTYWFSQARLFC